MGAGTGARGRARRLNRAGTDMRPRAAGIIGLRAPPAQTHPKRTRRSP